MKTQTDEILTTAAHADGRALIERLFEAMERGDLTALRSLFTDDFVMEWPQSGERFSGPDNAIAAVQAQEESPTPAGEPRILGNGDVWVAMMPLAYGSEIHHYVGVFELRDGRIARATELFGAPFPPKDARAAYRD